ncbi:hypothetical protein DFH07DRAFT_955013 [Mycena maculata]|uniref:Uncharacterized protein n=1 Tax=Mycena maculata TaxID=230809 RepID=A0AAD7JMW2_9AGAR|nr:hypothetical protein DFH07DRAFT_955013 [Mycena maculata]
MDHHLPGCIGVIVDWDAVLGRPYSPPKVLEGIFERDTKPNAPHETGPADLKNLPTGHADLVAILPTPSAVSTSALLKLSDYHCRPYDPMRPKIVRTKPRGTYSGFLDYGPWASFTPTWDRNGRAIIPHPACKPQAHWSSPRSPPPRLTPCLFFWVGNLLGLRELLAGGLQSPCSRCIPARPSTHAKPRTGVPVRQAPSGRPRTPNPARPTPRWHPRRPNPAWAYPHAKPHMGVPVRQAPSGRPHTPSPADPTPSGRPHMPSPADPTPCGRTCTPNRTWASLRARPCASNPAQASPHAKPRAAFPVGFAVAAPQSEQKLVVGTAPPSPCGFPQGSLRCKPLAGIPAWPSPCGYPCAAVPAQASLRCKPREAVPVWPSPHGCPCAAQASCGHPCTAIPAPQSLCGCPCVGIPAVQTPHGYPYAAVPAWPFCTPVDTHAAVLTHRPRRAARSWHSHMAEILHVQDLWRIRITRSKISAIVSRPCDPHAITRPALTDEALDSRQTHPPQLPWALHQAPGPALRAPNLNRGSSRASPCGQPRVPIPVWASPWCKPHSANPVWASPHGHSHSPVPALLTPRHHPHASILANFFQDEAFATVFEEHTVATRTQRKGQELWQKLADVLSEPCWVQFQDDWLDFTLGGEIVGLIPGDVVERCQQLFIDVLWTRYSTTGSQDGEAQALDLLLEVQMKTLKDFRPFAQPPADFCWLEDIQQRMTYDGDSDAGERNSDWEDVESNLDEEDDSLNLDPDYEVDEAGAEILEQVEVAGFIQVPSRPNVAALPTRLVNKKLKSNELPYVWASHVEDFFFPVDKTDESRDKSDVVEDLVAMRKLGAKEYRSPEFQEAIKTVPKPNPKYKFSLKDAQGLLQFISDHPRMHPWSFDPMAGYLFLSAACFEINCDMWLVPCLRELDYPMRDLAAIIS